MSNLCSVPASSVCTLCNVHTSTHCMCGARLSQEMLCTGPCDQENKVLCAFAECCTFVAKKNVVLHSCRRHLPYVCRRCQICFLDSENLCSSCDFYDTKCGVRGCGRYINEKFSMCRIHWDTGLHCRKCFTENCDICHVCETRYLNDCRKESNGWCARCFGPFDVCDVLGCSQPKPNRFKLCYSHSKNRNHCPRCAKRFSEVDESCTSCHKTHACSSSGCPMLIRIDQRMCRKHLRIRQTNLLNIPQADG